MGRHKEWRKIAKKERRRKIRTRLAKQQEKLNSSENFIKEQELRENLMLEQIEKTNIEENRKWIEADKIALEQWKTLQEVKARLLHYRLVQEAKQKLEWEAEQKKKKLAEEKIKAAQEEIKKKREALMEKLDKFLCGESDDPPSELKAIHETRPHAELCPFFYKTSCCRFGDHCSRSHQYPQISKVLLARNFYTHFGLSNTHSNEYDTDIMLEYEDSDTHKEYEDFFYDVLSEFQKFGEVTQFKVCNNYEKHLRGNTFIEFADLRSAVAAYRSLHTRWYGGRQLSLQFCLINSWKKAICGLHLQRRCPKGQSCNFMHVFRNPNNLFSAYFYLSCEEADRSRSSPTRWRWSESPEPEDSKRRSPRRSNSSERRRRRSLRDNDDLRDRRRRTSRRDDRY